MRQLWRLVSRMYCANGPRAVVVALEMDVDDGVPVVLFHLEDGAVAQDAGVVDQDVAGAEARDRGVEDGLAAGGGGDGVVARDRLAAGAADRGHHLVGDARGAGAVDLAAEVVDHDLGSLAAEQERGLAPDPPAGAGDDRYLSVEHAHVRSSLKVSRAVSRRSRPAPLDRRQRRLARGLELVARLPGRQRVGLGDQQPAVERQPRVLDHAVVVPRLVELVRGLVVVLARVELGLLAAPLRRPSDVGGAGLEVETPARRSSRS